MAVSSSYLPFGAALFLARRPTFVLPLARACFANFARADFAFLVTIEVSFSDGAAGGGWMTRSLRKNTRHRAECRRAGSRGRKRMRPATAGDDAGHG